MKIYPISFNSMYLINNKNMVRTPKPQFSGDILDIKSKNDVLPNPNEDIETALEQKIIQSELIDTKGGAKGKLTVEKITLEDGTVLEKRTLYDCGENTKLNSVMLKYITNMPKTIPDSTSDGAINKYPYIRIEYSEEFNQLPGYCFARGFNHNFEQAHGVCMETKLR